MNKKQTAVEWLIEQICAGHTKVWEKEIKQALDMEYDQIVAAHGTKETKSAGVENYTFLKDGHQYYFETYIKPNNESKK